jgi:4'-phosphopantetheinyl transferase
MTVAPIRPSELHVWSASLLLAPEAVERLWRELAPDEQARAERLRTRDLTRRFIAGRAVLRRLLAGYLPADSGPISLAYGARGKPYLASAVAAASRISFNLSHADDTAVYAFARGRDVGIDIEATGREVWTSPEGVSTSLRHVGRSLRDAEIEGIARKVFSKLECEALEALPGTERRVAFFRIWARKEAYIKARGEGFGYPTRSFSVSYCADQDALIADDTDQHAPRRWRVIGLPAPHGFTAALAAEGREWSVRHFDAATLLGSAPSPP